MLFIHQKTKTLLDVHIDHSGYFLQANLNGSRKIKNPNKLTGEIFLNIEDKKHYTVLKMDGGKYRVFPLRTEYKEIIEEHSEFFKDNEIENFKQTMRFLSI